MYLVNNDILKSIRLIALGNVESNSIEWYVECAYRHYSKTYHTPLHTARELLTTPEVVKIFMEDELAGSSPEELVSLREKLSSKRQPLLNIDSYEEDHQEELSDEEWVLQEMAKAAKKEKDSAEKTPEATMADAAMQAQKAIQDLYKALNKPVPDPETEMKFGEE